MAQIKIEAATRLQAAASPAKTKEAIKCLKTLGIKAGKIDPVAWKNFDDGSWPDAVHLEVNGDVNAAVKALRKHFGTQPTKTESGEYTSFSWGHVAEKFPTFASITLFLPDDVQTEMTVIRMIPLSN